MGGKAEKGTTNNKMELVSVIVVLNDINALENQIIMFYTAKSFVKKQYKNAIVLCINLVQAKVKKR